MQPLYLYNTMTRKKEEFVPRFLVGKENITEADLQSGEVGLYTCGPTVYDYAHIGNLRTYIFEDILRRVLQYNDYRVRHIMNITDVGHLTGDMDMGEDKLEKGARRTGKSAWDIAKFYTKSFQDDAKHLNILEPTVSSAVTDNIPEQIALIKTLEEKGFTYRTSDGVYYDTSKFPNYNKLSHLKLEELQEGARVEINEEKKNPTDFALWKFSPKDAQRQMEWESPWGIGFPGWHLECSAISAKFLDKELDIHCGGIDHVNIHHTNEIAQSEAATGEKFFDYWLHGEFLNILGGKKMAKSDDNFLTLENAFIKKDISPLVYRFAVLQTHYRKPMEYSEESMKNAENGLMSLANKIRTLSFKVEDLDKFTVNEKFKNIFLEAVNDDLNMPQALAVVQEVLKSDLGKGEKLVTIMDFDRVLGLDLDRQKDKILPKEIVELIEKRKIAKAERNWADSDALRDEIQAAGYLVEDTKDEMYVTKK